MVQRYGHDCWDPAALGDRVAYRDAHTEGIPERLFAKLSRQGIYQRIGIQFLQFNSLYPLQASLDAQPTWLPRIAHLLRVPDSLHYRLTGALSCAFTNASTTQLINAHRREWDPDLLPLTEAGSRLGHWTSPRGQPVPVILPATPDTGSAVVATPLAGEGRPTSAGAARNTNCSTACAPTCASAPCSPAPLRPRPWAT